MLGALGSPPVVMADCQMPPAIEEAVETADIVFVGTVTQTSNRNSWASVEVEEVWKGPDQPAAVVVKGGPGGNSATSVDRAFEPGLRYVFFPYVDPTLGLADNSCTSTTQWSTELEALRPADFRQPIGAAPAEPGFDLGGLLGPLAVAVLVGGVRLGAGLLARGRQTG
jgi:hypothetical protein